MRYFLKYIRTWFIIKKKRFWRLADKSKGDQYTKFAILCSPRSGSTLLHTYLNSHDAILSHGEIIRRKIERGDELHSIYEYVFIPQAKQIKAVGLKLFYEYRNEERYKEPFEEVLADKEIKIIHLIRKDKRKQLTSLRKAEKSDIWSSTLKSEKDFEVTIKEEEFNQFEQEQNRLTDSTKKLFAAHNMLEITYEQLVRDPRNVLNEIQEFINVEPQALFTLLQKQS